MRTSLKAVVLVALSALVALQVAQPVSAGLIARGEDASPVVYDLERRATAVPTTSTSSSVKPTATPKTAGNKCTSNAGCVSKICTQGKCVYKDGRAPLAAFCNADAQCQGTTTTFCSTKSNSCTKKYDNGHSCSGDSVCSSGQCLNRVCIATRSRADGQTCSASVQCARNGNCKNGKCAVLVGPGQSCNLNASCTTGVCNSSTKRCMSGRKTGSTCTLNIQCATRKCTGKIGRKTCKP